MLSQHYSPHTPVRLHATLDSTLIARLPADEAILLLRKPATTPRRAKNIFWLSSKGRLAEIARNLFGQLRRLDQGAWTCIHVELPGDAHGLAPAIRDRLTRAAAKS
ncbi:MAG: hypothetical protein RL376_1060, partial [Verrucomicrobiota bacterium]|jgi:L-threonylcarbamoyladenylate synthase